MDKKEQIVVINGKRIRKISKKNVYKDQYLRSFADMLDKLFTGCINVYPSYMVK